MHNGGIYENNIFITSAAYGKATLLHIDIRIASGLGRRICNDEEVIISSFERASAKLMIIIGDGRSL